MGTSSNDDPCWWYHNRQRKIPLDDSAITAFIARLSEDLAPGDEVAVVVAGDGAVRQANGRFRGKSGSTDVLSFPDDEDGRLGDILISAARAARQAQEQGHSIEDEVYTLVLHGFLHLLGHDHESDQGEMGSAERRLRERYGLAGGLIERQQPC